MAVNISNMRTKREFAPAVVMDRERWFQLLMGENYRMDEAFTEGVAERASLPVLTAEASIFNFAVQSD